MNYGQIKVLVDWSDTGIPCSTQQGDPKNWIPNSAFQFSKLKYVLDAAMTAIPRIPPDSPINLINHPTLKNMNPYGLEVLDIATTTGGTIEIGLDGSGNFSIPIQFNAPYTLWVWIASEFDYTNDGDHALFLEQAEWNSAGDTQVAFSTAPFDVVAGYQITAVPISFTSDMDATYLVYSIGKADDDDTPFRAIVLGAMLLSDPDDPELEPTWNNGAELAYMDDITSYVVDAQGFIGKSTWENKLFDEGTLNLTLNNDSKVFSPENRDSILYELMQPYLRIWVLLSDSNNKFNLLWSGFTQQFSLQTGIYNERRSTLTCRQGKYAIEAQDDSSLDADDNLTSAEAIQLLFDGGYEIPSGSTDTDFTVAEILQDAEDGIDIPVFGIEFVGQEDKIFLTALENISEVNGNYTFLSRYGRVIFRTHNTVKDFTPDALPYGLTLDTHYIYAPTDLYKAIEVKYDSYSFISSGIEMQGQEQVVPFGSTSFPFRIDPKYNGKPLIGDVVLDVTSFLPVDYNAIIGSGSANASILDHHEGIYTWYSAAANNSLEDLSMLGLDARISFISRSSGNVWYASDINQSLVVAGIGGKGLPTLTYNNPVITNEDMANDFADMQATRRASIVSWFDTARIANKNAESIDFIINHTVGSIVYVQEEQSGNIPKHLIIIGEGFQFSPTYIEMTYQIAPTGGEVDIAAFTYDSEELSVDFIDLSVVPPEATYLWEFGD